MKINEFLEQLEVNGWKKEDQTGKSYRFSNGEYVVHFAHGYRDAVVAVLVENKAIRPNKGRFKETTVYDFCKNFF